MNIPMISYVILSWENTLAECKVIRTVALTAFELKASSCWSGTTKTRWSCMQIEDGLSNFLDLVTAVSLVRPWIQEPFKNVGRNPFWDLGSPKRQWKQLEANWVQNSNTMLCQYCCHPSLDPFYVICMMRCIRTAHTYTYIFPFAYRSSLASISATCSQCNMSALDI